MRYRESVGPPGSTGAVAASVAISADDWTNALEAALPAASLPHAFDVAVVVGTPTAAGMQPANVGYRFSEPVAGVYNDQRQSLALYEGTVDEFTTTIDLGQLRDGATQTARPGPGYGERHMVSGENTTPPRAVRTASGSPTVCTSRPLTTPRPRRP